MSSDTSVDIYTTPAGVPPPGVTPNLVNPFYLRTDHTVTFSLCLAVSTIAVALRFFTKLYLMKQFRAEDCILHFLATLVHEILIYPRCIDSNTSKNPPQALFRLRELSILAGIHSMGSHEPRYTWRGPPHLGHIHLH